MARGPAVERDIFVRDCIVAKVNSVCKQFIVYLRCSQRNVVCIGDIKRHLQVERLFALAPGSSLDFAKVDIDLVQINRGFNDKRVKDDGKSNCSDCGDKRGSPRTYYQAQAS